MKINHIRRRVREIERRISPTGPCPTCNGKGHLIVRVDGSCNHASIQSGNPCPACGTATVLIITGDDHTNPTPTAASAA